MQGDPNINFMDRPGQRRFMKYCQRIGNALRVLQRHRFHAIQMHRYGYAKKLTDKIRHLENERSQIQMNIELIMKYELDDTGSYKLIEK